MPCTSRFCAKGASVDPVVTQQVSHQGVPKSALYAAQFDADRRASTLHGSNLGWSLCGALYKNRAKKCGWDAPKPPTAPPVILFPGETFGIYVMTASKQYASASSIMISFKFGGKWTDPVVFNDEGPLNWGEEITKIFNTPETPTHIRLTNTSNDAWGYEAVSIVRDGVVWAAETEPGWLASESSDWVTKGKATTAVEMTWPDESVAEELPDDEEEDVSENEDEDEDEMAMSGSNDGKIWDTVKNTRKKIKEWQCTKERKAKYVKRCRWGAAAVTVLVAVAGIIYVFDRNGKATATEPLPDPEGVPSYVHYPDMGCKGRNELGTSSKTLEECSAACTSEGSCVSFEYNPNSKKQCQMSTSCAHDMAKPSSSGWHLYTKDAVDCAVSPWAKKGSCSSTCGGGTQKMVRTVTTEAAHGGAVCPALETSISCNDQPCPVDCAVSPWAKKGSCSSTCGGGTQKLVRTVTTEAAHGGAVCPALEASISCNDQPCLTHYDKYNDRACDGMNGLVWIDEKKPDVETREICARTCLGHSDCVSFEWDDSRKICQFSQRCNQGNMHSASDQWELYVKKL